MSGPTTLLTVIQPPNWISGRIASRRQAMRWRSSGTIFAQYKRWATQARRRPPKSIATTGARLFEKGRTRSGPTKVKTAVGRRKALVTPNCWWASNKPRSPAVLITTGIENASRYSERVVSPSSPTGTCNTWRASHRESNPSTAVPTNPRNSIMSWDVHTRSGTSCCSSVPSLVATNCVSARPRPKSNTVV